jgi:hypothetical protein
MKMWWQMVLRVKQQFYAGNCETFQLGHTS